MNPAIVAQNLYARSTPEMILSIGLIMLTVVVVFIALFRARKQLWLSLPLPVLTVFFALCFYPFTALVIQPQQNHFIWADWPPTGAEILLLTMLLVAIVAYGYSLRKSLFFLSSGNGDEKDPSASCDSPKTVTCLAYSAFCTGLMLFFLFYRLRDYADGLHTWETTVLWGFAQAFHADMSIGEYALKSLLWDNGILSQGNTSLFFGIPTYALFRTVGFSILTLRLTAAVMAILSALLFFWFSIRFFGRVRGVMMGCFLSLNIALLFYGKYGSSPTGMLFSLLLVLFISWKMLKNEKPTLLLSLAWVFALYIATLQYAPVRIFVVYDLGFVLLFFFIIRRKLIWKHYIIVSLVLISITAISLVQSHYGRFDQLFAARGEQFFRLATTPRIKQYLGLELRPEEIDLGIRIRLAATLLSATAREYLGLVLPTTLLTRYNALYLETGLPPLYFAPVGLFIIVGFIYSLVNFRKWQHLFLLVWVYYCTIPLLLTNRVDSHRLFLFVVPFSIWGGLGLWQYSEVMKRLKTPAMIRHIAAIFLVAVVLYANSAYLYFAYPSSNNNRETIQMVLAHIEGPVLVGNGVDSRERGAIMLDLLERTRLSKFNESYMMQNNTLHQILDQASDQERLTAVKTILKNMSERDTLILLPAHRFTETSDILQKHGLKVFEIEEDPGKVIVAWQEAK